MSFLSTIGRQACTEVTEEEVRAARARVARSNPSWTEIEAVDLVARGRYDLVSAETDARFMRHRGVVFEPGSSTVFATHSPGLWFYVDADGSTVFLERQPGTWSEYVERRERRRAAR